MNKEEGISQLAESFFDVFFYSFFIIPYLCLIRDFWIVPVWFTVREAKEEGRSGGTADGEEPDGKTPLFESVTRFSLQT